MFNSSKIPSQHWGIVKDDFQKKQRLNETPDCIELIFEFCPNLFHQSKALLTFIVII